MRIATYNIEWFNALFDDDGELIDDDGWSARHNITRSQQTEAVGIVLTAIRADAIMIVEAPDQNRRRSTVRALEGFAYRMGLSARKAVLGFENETQQEIALLYDPDKLSVRHDPIGEETGKRGSADAPRFDGAFRIDLDIDAKEDIVTFSKPPIELAVETATGTAFRMIGVHLKSKAPHGATNREAAMRIGIANRRKQLAQAVWLRQRIDGHLAAGETLMVMGDMNDGPGLDEYEDLFGRSSVEILLGEGEGALYDPHARAALTRKLGAIYSTSRFYQPETGRYMQALLDYIMVTRDLRARGAAWRIWHPFDDPDCWNLPELSRALLTASDHYPVTIDLDI